MHGYYRLILRLVFTGLHIHTPPLFQVELEKYGLE